MSEPISSKLDLIAAHTERTLENFLKSEPSAEELARPARLLASMRYAALGGGKRLRPFLVVETAALFGVALERALLVGGAIELFHSYSLVHDDLPAMDNDDLRRGRPTVHKAFDEATALLCGDALLTLAFDVLSHETVHQDAAVRLDLVRGLARAGGIGGLVGGQMLDLEAEGRFNRPLKRDEETTRTLQRMKTGALIEFACEAGAVIGRASPEDREAIKLYGKALGEAFQIADDLLDMGHPDQREETDEQRENFFRLRRRLKFCVDAAVLAIKKFGSTGEPLSEIATFVISREA